MPTAPPVGGVLLTRRAIPSLGGPDLYRITDRIYNPATRTVSTYTLPESAIGDEYSRPVDDLVDRWCENPGIAPFREIQVYHNGIGSVALVPVDGVTACQVPPCTLAVTLAASALDVNGRGRITATVSGAVGTTSASLDGFQTNPKPVTGTSVVFDNLPAGRYTVSIREDRPNGCTATATARLSATYGPRYQLDFNNLDGTPCRLVINERGYSGPTHTMEGQPSAVVLDWPGSPTDHVFTVPTRGSQCQLNLLQLTVDEYLPLFSGDERLHRVDYTYDSNLFWRGFLLPEQYDAAFLTPPIPFGLAATDGLGALSTTPFAGAAGEALRGDWTVLEIVLFCLEKLAVELPLRVLDNLYPAVATLAAGALEQTRFDVAGYNEEPGTPWDCGRVLTELLGGRVARLYQFGGAWYWERTAELQPVATTYAEYAPDGTRLADVVIDPLVSVHQSEEARPHWQGGGQRQGLRPAVARVAAESGAGDPANLLAFALPEPEDVPTPLPTGDFLPPGWQVMPALVPALYATLVYQGTDNPPLLRLRGKSGSRPINQAAWAQTPATAPVPFASYDGGYAGGTPPPGGFVRLSFTAKPYGNTPDPIESNQSRLLVAVRIGGVWVKNNGEESTTPIYELLHFPDGEEQKFELLFGRLAQRIATPQAVTVRFVGPLGGGTDCTVDISDLSLVWLNENVGIVDSLDLADRFTTRYVADTYQLVSRVDDETTLFHVDTPYVRRVGTLLDSLGRPTTAWYEAATPDVVREIGDFWVRDRATLQEAPAPMLFGTLRGELPGPGLLLTDPAETTPAVYALTSLSHDAAAGTWELMAVQLAGRTPPAAPFPDNAIYFDDDTAWLDENGRILVYENAY